MQSLDIQITDGVADAPKYGDDFKPIFVRRAVVVPKGTVEGNPTVDLQFTDRAGKKYVAMTTGQIIEALAKVLAAKRQETTEGGGHV
jgi:hypothetical protein